MLYVQSVRKEFTIVAEVGIEVTVKFQSLSAAQGRVQIVT